MALEADPAGLGILPMGCLDMHGYKMSDPKDFYQHMILEVVPNKINHHTYYYRDLAGLKNAHDRTAPRTFNPSARDAINLHRRMNVMYSTEPYARRRISRGVQIFLNGTDKAYWLAHANMESGAACPYFVAVPLPKGNEAPYVWIDVSWPIRSILLPVAQNKFQNVAPHCAYVNLNFTRLKGKLATSGWAEEPNTRNYTSNCVGDPKYGLQYNGPASLRVDIEKMYGTTVVPREFRKIEDDLDCLQLHRWNNIHADSNTEWNTYPGIDILDSGVGFDVFQSRRTGVNLQYAPREKSQLAGMMTDVASLGLNLVPVVGPLLVYFGTVAIDMLEDPYMMETTFERSFTNKDFFKALIDTRSNYMDKYIKSKKKNPFASLRMLPTSGSRFGVISAQVDFPGSRSGMIGPGQEMEGKEFDLFAPHSGMIGGQEMEGKEFDLFALCAEPLATLYAEEVEEFAKHPEWFAPGEMPTDLVLKGVKGEEGEEEPTTAGGNANDVDPAPAPAPADPAPAPADPA